MRRMLQLGIVLVGLLASASAAWAQSRPYIGFVYPAGGQQGTTFQVKIGGQNLGGVHDIVVSGPGVSAKVVEYLNPLGPQETRVLSEQLRELRGKKAKKDEATKAVADAIERRLREYVRTPSCAALRGLVYLEVTIAPDAPPGERELRLVTPRGGASNPLAFHVGHLPERSLTPMFTAPRSVLGKEEQALRKRPAEEAEVRIEIPCTVNGQVACGEINRYRFQARQGQRLVISTLARQLIPYIADAVPGWFQPVLTLYDAHGKEVAYNDDYRFQPDPVVLYQIPQDGEYVFTITDAIYRGREDFVYRITIGELPYVTSIFPLGGRVGESHALKTKGWNLGSAEITPPTSDAGQGVHLITANKDGFHSNRVPFALDTLPACLEKEPNDTPAHAQQVKLPVIVNGRMNRSDDWDVFQFDGRAGDKVVAEVAARRLDSPLDSVLRVTDAAGKVLAFNDDHQDLGSGLNTHHADSYVALELPADGTYFVHVGDAAANGGEEYGYRLRISAPQPDFALRVVPSSVLLRNKSTATVRVYAIRRDGFRDAITLRLKDPPAGFSASPVTLAEGQDVTKFTLKASAAAPGRPVTLTVEGAATIGGQELAHAAVPAEDRMQAFLWRHLVPAQEFQALVFDRVAESAPKRVPPELTPAQLAKAKAVLAKIEAAGQKTGKSQVAGRVRAIRGLYEDGLLTDEFYGNKMAEYGAMR